MLPSLVMPEGGGDPDSADRWHSRAFDFLTVGAGGLQRTIHDLIEPLLRTPKPMLLPTMLMLLASMPPRLLTSMLYCGLTVIWIRVAPPSGRSPSPELLSMVELPALTRALLYFTVDIDRTIGEQNRISRWRRSCIFADGEGAARYGMAADGAIVGHINLAGGQDSLVGINKLQPEQVMPFGLAIATSAF